MTIVNAAVTTGQRMTRARLWVGLEQSDMAALLGKTRQTIGNWERDVVEPPFSAVARWAKITGRSLDWIAYGDEGDEAPGEPGASIQSHLRESNPRPIHYEPACPDTIDEVIAKWANLDSVRPHATNTLG